MSIKDYRPVRPSETERLRIEAARDYRRIAELEAENRELQLDLKDVLKKRDLCEARREQAETEAERVRRERDTWWAWHERQVLEQAEAELTALKADTTVLISAIWESTERLLNRCAEKEAK